MYNVEVINNSYVDVEEEEANTFKICNALSDWLFTDANSTIGYLMAVL